MNIIYIYIGWMRMREIKRETREIDRKREREWCAIFFLVNMECGGLQIPVT